MKIKRLPIDTHPDNTAFMLRGGQEYTAEQFQALQKIRIYSENREILATLALVDDRDILQERHARFVLLMKKSIIIFQPESTI